MRKRPRCPFYGFAWPEKRNHLSDEGDNRCALLFNGGIPCVMEREGLPIVHYTCDVYLEREAVIQIARRHIVFHPREFPEGIPFQAWDAYLAKEAEV